MSQFKTKYVSKIKMITLLKNKGHKEINLTYHKSEGWWLDSNLFDNWLASTSVGAYNAILKLEKDKNYLYESRGTT